MLLIKRIIFILTLLPLAMCQAADEKYKAGEHYDILPQQVRTASSDKIEVNEVFAYTCGHCFNFQAELHPWVEKLAADVDFQSTPAIWQPKMEAYARAYYAAKILNVLDQVHMPIFEAIHLKKRAFKNEADFAEIFSANGVDSKKFSSAFSSFGTTSMITQAKSRVRAYKVRGTPEMIINGKYRVSTTSAAGFSGMLKVAEFLIDKERALAAK
ncbi:MAG: Thiol:disulfide interchange protein DsbA [Cellvibrionales bacterium UBA7375]|nr:disulfide bond formation protein DsbA [Gammaproteobacteria bacterium]CAI8167556.1 MAG: Thiol:disulfide interchange protein DsbA [Cellvibrionales bacterium UBA7375]